MEQQVLAFIKKHHLIEAGDEVIAGISGGVDSMCLLFLLIKWERQLGFRLRIVHVRHGIRNDLGEGDRQFVEQICRDWGRPCHTVCLDVPAYARQQGLGMEEAARILRYRTFAELAEQSEADGRRVKIAVAHHRNDQMETMLWNMTRGSSLRGMRGMLPVSGRIVRPFLETDKSDLLTYAVGHEIPYCEDESNTALNFTRNRIRHAVIPELLELNNEAVAHFANLAADMQEMEGFLSEQAARILETATDGQGALIGTRLQGMAPVLQRQVLLQWLDAQCLDRKDLQRSHLQALLCLCMKPGHGSVSLPGGWRIDSSYGRLLPEASGDWRTEEDEAGRKIREQRKIENLILASDQNECVVEYGRLRLRLSRQPISQGKVEPAVAGEGANACQIYFDYDKIKGQLSVRMAEPDDRLALGEGRGHKSVRRFAIDAKIAQDLRRRLPAIVDEEGILWLIGYRRSSRAYVTDETKTVGVITCEYKEG